MPLSFILAALLAYLLAASPLEAATARRAGGAVPNLDVAAGCRDISTMDLNKTNYSRCMSEEDTARSQLQGVWTSFRADTHEQCLHLVTPPALPSYVTLQECLNMSRDAERLGKTAPGIGPGSETITPGPR